MNLTALALVLLLLHLLVCLLLWRICLLYTSDAADEL